MAIIFPLLTMFAAIFTGVFVYRRGLVAYRERNAISVFALGIAVITYAVGSLAANIIDRIGWPLFLMHEFIRLPSDRQLVVRQAIAMFDSLPPLALVIYLVVLIRRDIDGVPAERNRLRETSALAALAALCAFSGLLRL